VCDDVQGTVDVSLSMPINGHAAQYCAAGRHRDEGLCGMCVKADIRLLESGVPLDSARVVGSSVAHAQYHLGKHSAWCVTVFA
jgi:hypothetical protein